MDVFQAGRLKGEKRLNQNQPHSTVFHLMMNDIVSTWEDKRFYIFFEAEE